MSRLSALFVLAFALSACGPVAAVVIADGNDVGNDGDVDGDTDPDSDVDDDTDPDTEPEPIYGEWFGQRFLEIGRCDGELNEFGVLIEDEGLAEACPECDMIYQVEVEPRQICGLGVRSPTYRGVILGRRDATVINIAETDRGWAPEPLADGFAENEGDIIFLSYEYEGEAGRQEFEVKGVAELIRTN